MKRLWAVLGAVVVLVAGGVAFVACQPDSDDAGPPSSGGGQTQEPADEGMSVEEFESAVLEGDAGTSEVIGSVEGALTDRAKQVPARVDVTQVLADEHSTVLRFTLTNPADAPVSIGLQVFNQRAILARDVRDVAIVDPVAQQRYQPFIGVSVVDEKALTCACSTAPLSYSGTGVLLTATFPPLDASTETVSVDVPWLGMVEDLPVTRR